MTISQNDWPSELIISELKLITNLWFLSYLHFTARSSLYQRLPRASIDINSLALNLCMTLPCFLITHCPHPGTGLSHSDAFMKPLGRGTCSIPRLGLGDLLELVRSDRCRGEIVQCNSRHQSSSIRRRNIRGAVLWTYQLESFGCAVGFPHAGV